MALSKATMQAPTATGYKQPFFRLNEETATNGPLGATVTGQIPDWVNGSLYRNGPGIFTIGDNRLRHLFDGFSVLHRFDLHCGKVTYTSRVLDTKTWTKSVKAKRLVTTQFGTYAFPDPCKKMFSRVMSYFKSYVDVNTDNTAVSIVKHGDRLYALTETPRMVTVDPQSLKNLCTDQLDRVVAVHLSTAHPHFDTEGNMYNLGTCLNPPHHYNIIQIPTTDIKIHDSLSTAVRKVALTSRWSYNASYNHSFGMSRDHFIILEQPITMSTVKFTTSNWRRASAFENFDKHPNAETVFRVVRREDGVEIDIKYRTEPTFTFHFVNCFEDNDELVVDFIGYSDLDIIDSLYVDRLDEQALVKPLPLFRRYVLPLSLACKAAKGQNLVKFKGTSATAVLRDDGTVFLTADYITSDRCLMELPRINYEMVNGRPYRYVYGTSIFSENPQLKKLDLEKKEEQAWGETGYQPGEPVFVQRPGAIDEDDGVVLSPMVSMEESKPCFLVVLDAHTFTELARAVTPPTMKWPLTFHGTYLPQAD